MASGSLAFMGDQQLSFADALHAVIEGGPASIARFAASLPPEWIQRALEATGTATIRRRKLPADQAVWLVLGMALFADRSIANVVEHLSLVIPGADSLSSGAATHARYRLGPDPMQWLFDAVAMTWAADGGAAPYRGLALHAIDGTCIRVQDSDENFEHFGKPGGRSGSGDSGYPQLRLACLLNLQSRMLVDAEFGAFATSEQTLASSLWPSIPNNSLTLVDRGFSEFMAWSGLVTQGENRHLMARIRRDTPMKQLMVLDDGTLLVDIPPSHNARAADSTVEPLRARIIEYQHQGGEACRLLVTLLDPKAYPAKELIQLYHERWELEIAFDELKTHMLQRKECLRSKLPDGVAQELWGVLVVYNLLRREMLLAAKELDVDPNRVSFVNALLWIRTFWLASWRDTPGRLPEHLGEFRRSLKTLLLPERRADRRYPRHVKIKMSNYARNRSTRAKSAPEEPK